MVDVFQIVRTTIGCTLSSMHEQCRWKSCDMKSALHGLEAIGALSFGWILSQSGPS